MGDRGLELQFRQRRLEDKCDALWLYNHFMALARMLDIKNTAIDPLDDGLDTTWLELSYEERLARHAQILLQGWQLEAAIGKTGIRQRMDKTVRYDLLRDAF